MEEKYGAYAVVPVSGKKVFKSKKIGRRNEYRALITEEEYQAMQTHGFINKVYGGNVKNLITTLLQQDVLLPEELNEIERFWREKEKMSEFMKILISLSFSGTVLMLWLFLLKPLYKNKFSKSYQYYIWLIVALRFLLPVTWEPAMTLTGYVMEKMDTVSSGYKNIRLLKEKAELVPTERNEQGKETKTNKIAADQIKADNGTIEKTTKGNIYGNDGSDSQNFTNNFTVSWGFYLFFLWLSVAFLLFLRKVLLYQSFLRDISRENREVSDIEILNVLADCEEKARISRPIELYRNPLIGSPVMVGFLKPKIIISTGEYKKEELFYIFLHELVHYKRRDLFYKWFIQIVICIHWFNPFVYLLGKEINRACELSCDEAVLSETFGDKEKRAYGDALVSVLKMQGKYQVPGTSIMFTEDVRQIKERLGAIMDFQKKSKGIKGIMVVFTILVCTCFTALGAYASGGADVLQDMPESTVKKSNKQNDNNDSYAAYRQDGFFYAPYVIEMAWNVKAKDRKNVASAEITLENQTEMTVYFSKKTKEYANDKKALAAVKGTIEHFKNAGMEGEPVIKAPYICRVDYVPLEQIADFADKYYKKEDIIGFSAIFPALDAKKQKNYWKKMYQQDRIAFFSCSMDSMGASSFVSKKIRRG